MKKLSSILFIPIFLLGCNTTDKSKQKEVAQNTETNNEAKKKETVSIKEESTPIDFDFCTDCDELEIWQGGIQGGPESDKSCCYVMGQCQTNKHYDIIVYSPREITLSEGTNSKEGVINSNISDATYYAFEIPKTKPKNPENEFDTFDYIFPSEVHVYQKTDSTWNVINTKKVHSFEDLGALKQQTINTKIKT